MIKRFTVICLAEFPERLGKVVNNQAVVIGEEVIPHHWHFPARQVVVDSVQKRDVIPDHSRHRVEEVAALNHHIHWLPGITKHAYAGVTGALLGPTLKFTGFAVGL